MPRLWERHLNTSGGKVLPTVPICVWYSWKKLDTGHQDCLFGSGRTPSGRRGWAPNCRTLLSFLRYGLFVVLLLLFKMKLKLWVKSCNQKVPQICVLWLWVPGFDVSVPYMCSYAPNNLLVISRCGSQNMAIKDEGAKLTAVLRSWLALSWLPHSVFPISSQGFSWLWLLSQFCWAGVMWVSPSLSLPIPSTWSLSTPGNLVQSYLTHLWPSTAAPTCPTAYIVKAQNLILKDFC